MYQQSSNDLGFTRVNAVSVVLKHTYTSRCVSYHIVMPLTSSCLLRLLLPEKCTESYYFRTFEKELLESPQLPYL